MPIVIKELVISAKVNKGSKETDEDIIKIIDSKINKISSQGSLKETVKRQIIDECVAAVLKELESKLDY